MRTRTDVSHRWRTFTATATIAIVVSVIFLNVTPTHAPAVTTLNEPSRSAQKSAITAPPQSAALAIEQPAESTSADEPIAPPVTLDDLAQDPDPEIREEAQALAELLAQETAE